MKTLLKLEDLAELAVAVFAFTQLDYAWWWFPALILVPDLSMIGYLAGPRIGAYAYNLAHHKATGLFVAGLGYFMGSQVMLLAGIILFAHSAMDRVFGYGLKYTDDFKHTHLGKIGK